MKKSLSRLIYTSQWVNFRRFPEIIKCTAELDEKETSGIHRQQVWVVSLFPEKLFV